MDMDHLERLKAAVDAGYYSEEYDPDAEPTIIPWAGKTCKDCPFFISSAFSSYPGKCRIRGSLERRPEADTCRFFDPESLEEGNLIVNSNPNADLIKWCKHGDPVWWQ